MKPPGAATHHPCLVLHRPLLFKGVDRRAPRGGRMVVLVNSHRTPLLSSAFDDSGFTNKKGISRTIGSVTRRGSPSFYGCLSSESDSINPPSESASEISPSSDMEAPSASIQVRLVLPFIFAVLRIERAELQRLELEREARAKLLQAHGHVALARIVLKDVAVVPEKDEIALVVHRDYLPPLELRVVREQAREHAAEPMAQPGGEIVQDQLRSMRGRPAMPTDPFGQHERRQLEPRCRSSWQLDQP
mmetsp:Transcript_2214/g.4967  ORF Transcript_2214/g.4967 Transcript_2214/m.4967 type:complete len:246 (-) Transcript_2214:513-1250(-)